ncbi:MAG TPA: ATP-dependent sacrificial sulfur transferase LarE [Spirochaetota bacterium]|nr:ATP-dependent sacrificial sulfur transferase LarE [Spirochaetota bacterium]
MHSASKLDKLKNIISRYQSAVIAFSGGADSTFLARITADTPGCKKVLLVTASSPIHPLYELEAAKKLAQTMKVKHLIINTAEIGSPYFSNNPPDRCYYCKKELFTRIKQIAAAENYAVVFDGSNTDDRHDFRPGSKALKELGIKSPLQQAGISKAEIRNLSRTLKLPTADKPAYACLASRFPYGENITTEKLERVSNAELKLRELGFKQFRVRSHDNLARIEINNKEIEKGWKKRKKLIDLCKSSGFTYVTIDLEGYRTGSMNEGLPK